MSAAHLLKTHRTKALLAIALTSAVLPTMATELSNPFVIIEPENKSELWINPGMATYHFQQDKNFNGANWGAGLEYRFNTVWTDLIFSTTPEERIFDNLHLKGVGGFNYEVQLWTTS